VTVPPAGAIAVIPVSGIGEVGPGADLARLIASAAGPLLVDHDVVVVASKVVAKAERRLLIGLSREAACDAETTRVVAERRTPRGVTRITQSRSGPVLAAAGVDASNLPAGGVLPLPADPDASARALRAALRDLTGQALAVVITDSAGRPWREGQVDLAVGAAGLDVLDDLRGRPDTAGNPLEVTVRAVADEIAAAADLVKGKLAGIPVAVVRGLGQVRDDDGPGAAALLRAAADDWFRLGHAEAARAAIGMPPGGTGVEPVVVPAEPALVRLERAVRVAVVAPDPLSGPPEWDVRLADDAVTVRSSGGDASKAAYACGALAQRIAVAAWAEDVVVRLTISPGGSPVLTARITTDPGEAGECG
jgi:coenzyme F420-0:L-glutamate ligase/coenzyme F420-1:gamma-L-glutamate ligase